MTHKYHIDGLSCNGCRTKVETTLRNTAGVTHAEVTLTPPQAIVSMEEHIPIQTLQAALSAVGKYTITPDDGHHADCCATPAPVSVPNIKPAKGSRYYCPMHCEGDKTYDKPGDCPVCGMSLEPLAVRMQVQYT